MPGKKGYSLREVAQRAGVVNATIVRWIETGRVKVPKRKNARGHYLFTEADRDRLILYRRSMVDRERRRYTPKTMLAGDPTIDAPPPRPKPK